MKRIVAIIVSVVASVVLFAQQNKDSTNNRPENNYFLTGCGDVSTISFNYERLFIFNSVFFIAGKLGMGFTEDIVPFQLPKVGYITIPIHITANYGEGKNFLEFGMGGTYIPDNKNIPAYYFYPILGYRFQPLNTDRFFFRIYGSYPLSGVFFDGLQFVPVGISLGFAVN